MKYKHVLEIEHIYLKGLFLLTADMSLLQSLYDLDAYVAADLGARPTENGSRIRKLAAYLGVPAVVTPDCDMVHREQSTLRCLLDAIGAGTTLLSNSDEKNIGWNSLAAPEEYVKRFAVWPEVLAATEEVAEQCEYDGPETEVIMPPWDQGGKMDDAEVLKEEAYCGARSRYGDDLTEIVVDRLEHELQIISRMNYSSYFLVVRDIVHPPQSGDHRQQRRICGRGSGAASLVAYCLRITNVCPIKHNLYFERFLNPGRSDPPDIDIDFAWDERDSILGEVLADFGVHAAMVSNHVCFKPRMAIRETARVYGIPEYEISRMTKRLPWFHQRGDETLEGQISRLPSLKDQDFSGPWPQIIELAGKLVGLPRYLSVHPGGIVITPAPVSNYVPVEMAAKGVPIIQWEKDGAEEAGLVKIDLLGNRSLAVIRDAVAGIRKNGVIFSERNWEPENDEATKVAVSHGRTMGCFYIESPAMRLLQKKANSGAFEQLVIQSSIIRPAANEFVREYVRRLHGGTWEPLHPELESVLDETFGLMVYQEDVSKVAVALAGFSHSDGDGLRKILSKKDKERRLLDYRTYFFTGCRARGLADSEIEKIWAMMMSFDGYSFCKPHSASYARVSYQAAYLKTHFPAEFMAAVISNMGGFYSTFAYVSEAKRLGIVIDPPCIRLSAYRWQGKAGRMRVGLQSVSELSTQTAEKILDSQRNVYSSLYDFLHGVQPAGNEARSLAHAGALDCLNSSGNRSVLLWEISMWEQEKAECSNLNLFDTSPVSSPFLPPQEEIDRLRSEYRALGFLCGMHPICLVRNRQDRTIKARDAAGCVGRRIDFSGWLLTGKMVSTKTGDVMEFLTFEDETGLLEATFFPGTYQRYAHILSTGKPYLLKGVVESDYGAVTLTVEKVKAIAKVLSG